MSVRLALAADLPSLSVALAEAFVDDPMMMWIAGDRDADERRAVMAPGFFLPALSAGLARGRTYAAADLTGAAIWSPPDTTIFDDISGAAFGGAMNEHLGADSVMRIVELGQMVSQHHPDDTPHFYLFVLGTATMGQGLGGDLMRPVIERCDADGLPAYLESSNARNVAFYQRHGFQVQWEDRPAANGPLLRGMWREPDR